MPRGNLPGGDPTSLQAAAHRSACVGRLPIVVASTTYAHRASNGTVAVFLFADPGLGGTRRPSDKRNGSGPADAVSSKMVLLSMDSATAAMAVLAGVMLELPVAFPMILEHVAPAKVGVRDFFARANSFMNVFANTRWRPLKMMVISCKGHENVRVRANNVADNPYPLTSLRAASDALRHCNSSPANAASASAALPGRLKD